MSPVARAWFVESNRLGLEEGQRVRFWQRNWQRLVTRAGEGTITLIWFGIEETVGVLTDDGDTINLYIGREFSGEPLDIIEKREL